MVFDLLIKVFEVFAESSESILLSQLKNVSIRSISVCFEVIAKFLLFDFALKNFCYLILR